MNKFQPNTSSDRNGEALLKLSFVESFDALEKLEEDWIALDKSAGKSQNVFQTFPWCWHWANHAVKGDNASWRLKILIGRSSGKLVLIWPMAIPLGALINEARWLGEPLTQYGDVILADNPMSEIWLHEAWRYLLAQHDIDLLHLRKVRVDAHIHPILKYHASKMPGSEKAPNLNLKPFNNFDELNTTFTSKIRKDRRRKRRRLSELGDLQVSILKPGARADAALSTALEFKNAWLKNSGRHNSTFNDENTVATLHDMISGKQHPVDCLISILLLDNEPLAIEIGFVKNKTYFTHIGAFNPWFYVHSPGKVLRENTISEVINRGYECYDLMAPADQYKTRWTDSQISICDHAMPISMRGVMHMGLYLKLFRPGLKALYKKMPAFIRQKAARFG